jgi:uncharacterized membrane protein
MTIKHISLIIMALLYLGAGINHFRVPKFYERIVPSYFKNKKFINEASGVAELILGIGLLIPATSTLAAWGVIALLVAVFPAHIYQLQQKGAGMKVPMWALWLRIPLQFVLIAWAYWYTF